MAALANSLKDNPRLDRWLRFLDDRTVRIGTGKVELGQGVLTALAQIAAEELDLRIDQISMMSGNSIEGPAEGYTASSWSIEHSGSAIRLVAAEVRALACLQAALRLNASPEELTIVEGTFFRNGIASGLDYWAIAGELDLSREATGRISPKAADETAVRAAAVAAAEYAVWSGARVLRPDSASAEWLAAQPSTDALIGDPPVEAQIDRLSYTFTRPFLSHGSLAPSCALALYRQGTLTVWSHAQGMHPLRDNIARTLGLPIENVACHHLQGAGCYGHNGADDAALDAALVAMALPDQPIRLMWRREEEFGYEPLSSAMTVTVHAALDAEGRPCDWTTEVWSATHGQRPGVGGAYLLAAEALKAPPPERMPFDIPLERGGGAVRNAVPLYDIAGKRISYHLIHDIPLRTSSLRGLGATLNVFAIEAMMDELADRAGQDPVAYRLSSLSDPRARATLERAAEMADWSSRGSGGAGNGRGIAIARYKNSSAYAAVVAAVAVDEAVRVTEVWCAVDAGLVINPDGVVNQIEGNIVQAISWALIEEVCLGSQGVTSVDWQSYPVIRFKDVPEIHVELINARQHPALGVGECAGGPTAAAIGNAVADALGMRIHDMPMTRERIMAAVLQA